MISWREAELNNPENSRDIIIVGSLNGEKEIQIEKMYKLLEI